MLETTCPWPERYSSNGSRATEYEVIDLVAGFIRALQPNYVIETGTYRGDTSEAIGKALQKNGQGKLDTLELDADLAQAARVRLYGLPVTVHTCDSTKFVPTEPPQFVWFDSSFAARGQEFFNFYWQGFLHPGAIVGFHDVDKRFPVGDFVFELVDRRLISAIALPTHRGVAFGQVL